MNKSLEINQLVDHFFRHDAGKMVAVLTHIFGLGNLHLAEDVVQDSLVEAISQWQYKGIPDNPSAWLFRVAKNKALNIVNREKYKRRYSEEASRFLHSEWTAEPALDHLFSEGQIQDDQLRMLFTCCHPSLSSDSQIALALKTLCGFSIGEIAKAFLTSEENINKRLVRARQKIRDDKIPFEVPKGKDLEDRLQTVLDTIYLLFNEGYSASKGNDVVRLELCEEAIRLADIVSSNKVIQEKSTVFALQALMQLNASRFKARQDDAGNILTLQEQNRLLWDYALMKEGFINLEKAAAGNQISTFHILAAISAYHCVAANYQSTDWKAILMLYDRLLEIENSPVVLLNRAIALSKVKGPEAAIEELEKIEKSSSLRSNYLYYSTLGTFQIELERFGKAIPLLEKAIRFAYLIPIIKHKRLKMRDFLLILRTEGSVWTDLSAEELQKHMEHGMAYISKLISQGRLKSAAPVDKGSKMVSGAKGLLKDHPFNESKEVVAGYFLITAKDIDEAVAIAKENPIFNDIPTKIEVHPMMPVGGAL